MFLNKKSLNEVNNYPIADCFGISNESIIYDYLWKTRNDEHFIKPGEVFIHQLNERKVIQNQMNYKEKKHHLL